MCKPFGLCCCACMNAPATLQHVQGLKQTRSVESVHIRMTGYYFKLLFSCAPGAFRRCQIMASTGSKEKRKVVGDSVMLSEFGHFEPGSLLVPCFDAVNAPLRRSPGPSTAEAADGKPELLLRSLVKRRADKVAANSSRLRWETRRRIFCECMLSRNLGVAFSARGVQRGATPLQLPELLQHSTM